MWYSLNFLSLHLRKAKIRPALVLLSDEDNDVVVARITSKIYHTDFDINVIHWNGAGLLKPSVVRIHKLGTFEDVVIKRKLGTIASSDRLKVVRAIEKLLKKMKKI